MEPTSETRVLDTPCVICGGTITLTLEYKRHILRRGWATYAECVNHCNLQQISNNCFQEWDDLCISSDKKAVLEQNIEQYEIAANRINLARQKGKFCVQLPRLVIVSSEPEYKFLCDCPSLTSLFPATTIEHAAGLRTNLIEERTKKEAKSHAEKQTVSQFNKRSERLTEAAHS